MLAPWTVTLIVIGIILIAAIVFVDWKKHRRLLMVILAVALFVSLYQSGLLLLIPGASHVAVWVDSVTHARPVSVRPVAFGYTRDTEAWTNFRGEMLAIDVEIYNTGSKPIPATTVCELHDIWGREFGPGGFSSGDSRVLLGHLNPGLSLRATIVFDVPSARGLWWLTVYPGNSKTNGATVPIIVL